MRLLLQSAHNHSLVNWPDLGHVSTIFKMINCSVLSAWLWQQSLDTSFCNIWFSVGETATLAEAFQ